MPEPGAVVVVASTVALFVIGYRRARARGLAPGVVRALVAGPAIGALALALLSPLDSLAHRSIAAHMAQHVLLADVAVPLLLIAFRAPVGALAAPPTLVARFGRARRLRRALAWLVRPTHAVPIYALVLLGWHLGPAFEAALRWPLLHALQHQSFVLASVLVWWPIVEPARRRPRHALWKLPYLFAARFAGMALAMGIAATRSPLYPDSYGLGERWLGLDPLGDQRLGAALMFSTDVVVLVVGLTLLFFAAARADQREGEAPRIARPSSRELGRAL